MDFGQFNPLWIIVVLSLCALVGTLAVARYRVGVLERRMDHKSGEIDDLRERLARIEALCKLIAKNGGIHVD